MPDPVVDQTKRRPRVLLVTSNPPCDAMGGSMLLYRQFAERDDYELLVVTDLPTFSSDKFPSVQVEQPAYVRRLLRTRLSLWASDYMHVMGPRLTIASVWQQCSDFAPDIVMMGAETWLADLAAKLARRLRVPLVGHFMDWPSYGMRAHNFLKRRSSQTFQRRYQACDLAFGICPEMLNALGPHRNSVVFYPPGRLPKVSPSSDSEFAIKRLLFAGNLGEWYGSMLLELAGALEGADHTQLRIAGKNHEWSRDEKDQLTRTGVFAGFLKGDQYRAELEAADALLVIMGFDQSAKQIESTSFKSKLSDYLTTGKPVIVWGPEYSTAAIAGKDFGFAEVVTDRPAESVVAALTRIRNDSGRLSELVDNGRQFYNSHLSPDVVFTNAHAAICRLLSENPS